MSTEKIAIVTGVLGQDGTYLTNHLLELGYKVYGFSRNLKKNLYIQDGKFELINVGNYDADTVDKLINRIRPDEIYNLAAMASSLDLEANPLALIEANSLLTVKFLESIRKSSKQIKFFQASSSEIYGKHSSGNYQDENTGYSPVNFYGLSKTFAMESVKFYRERYGLLASTGILYNHESPLRPKNFVTRKITNGVANILKGKLNKIVLGDLDSTRDWSHVKDFVRAYQMIVSSGVPGEYIISSGKLKSVRNICDIAFSHVGLNYLDYVIEQKNSNLKSNHLARCGNHRKITNMLGWEPQISFESLIIEMVKFDIDLNE